MNTPADTAQSIRAALEPFVRPREEAATIRRVLKAHLAASLKSDDDVLDGASLALVNIAWDTSVSSEARGLQRSYLRALQANLVARRAFEKRAAETSTLTTTGPNPPAAGQFGGSNGGADAKDPSSVLQDHLVTVKLGRKRDRLQIVNRYLDALGERPVAVAAGEDYLQPEFIYGDATRALPPVPKAVVDGLAEDDAERAAAASGSGGEAASSAAAKAATDLESLVSQLEKSVLRAQLALRQEEKRLASAKAEAGAQRGPATQAAKIQALGAARDELISWMETELGNAANEEKEDDDDDDGTTAESSRLLRQSLLNGHGDAGTTEFVGDRRKTQLGEKLTEIHSKYAQYVEARRTLVETVGSMWTGGETASTAAHNPLFKNMPKLGPPQIEGKERTKDSETKPTDELPQTLADNATAAAEKSTALGHLLMTPYLERLLTVAHDQKADIAHKAHYNMLLAKRLKDTCQMLDHLADESQLLPRYGPQGSRGAGEGPMAVGGGGAALLRKKGILAPQGRHDSGPDVTAQRVVAWTDAADSAKIATFEAVFEKVEEGQSSLEKATQALAEADILLGRPSEAENDNADEKTAGGQAAQQKGAPAKQSGGDIWAMLDGELGLLKADSRA